MSATALAVLTDLSKTLSQFLPATGFGRFISEVKAFSLNTLAQWLLSLREKCPYSGFFSSVFSRIRTEYGEILRISSYSVQMQESMDQKNSEYGHFSRSFYSMPLKYLCQTCNNKTVRYKNQ